MDKSTLFNQSHQIARNTVAQVGDYMIAFSLAWHNQFPVSEAMSVSPDGLKTRVEARMNANYPASVNQFPVGGRSPGHYLQLRALDKQGGWRQP